MRVFAVDAKLAVRRTVHLFPGKPSRQMLSSTGDITGGPPIQDGTQGGVLASDGIRVVDGQANSSCPSAQRTERPSDTHLRGQFRLNRKAPTKAKNKRVYFVCGL
ncbi:unnamed protein product [Ectocarpus sp. 12 AP-2014]